MESLAQEQCVPDKDQQTKLPDKAINDLHMSTPMWEVVDVDGIKRLQRSFDFSNYADALAFTARVGRLAQEQNHHPTITTRHDGVSVEWYTFKVKGLHRNDFVMAAKTDSAYLRLMDESRAKSPVQEASEESFPASDSPGWIGNSAEKEG